MSLAVLEPIARWLLAQRLLKADATATDYGKDVWSSEVRSLHQNKLSSLRVLTLPVTSERL